MATTTTAKRRDTKSYAPVVRKTAKATKAADVVISKATELVNAQSKRNLLTGRQQETLKLLVEGLTNKQIAQILNISVKTVDAHRASIMARLQIHSLAGLVKYAIRTGLTSLD